MKALEQFILDTPYLFLKKIPYVWIAVVAFWHWPPYVSGILMLIVLVGLLMMVWQQRAWEARIRRELHNGTGRVYFDRPRAAWTFQLRNFLLVCLGSGLLGWLLNGRFGINVVQWFLMLAGTMLLYKDSLLFGAMVTYMLTSQGIGIRFVPGHVDYRMFFRYNEIRRAVRVKVPRQVPLRWDILAPRRRPAEGVLLYAASPSGFTSQLQGEILLAPADMDGFLKELSGHVLVVDGSDDLSRP
jgi:hypothetical protein